jgi:hypothetical protein
MRPLQLVKLLTFAIDNGLPILIKGSPGIGKSDIVSQACRAAGAELIISHPVVSDPTDYKGLPFASGNEAHFLPFNELKQLIEAKVKTVFFLDDLGQAPPAVQAACMQLILAREINGKKISDFVTFIAATNRKEDKAGVSGLLEPVKSRFASIVELEVNTDDWVQWALGANMPIELIAFIRYRPALLNDFKASKDIVNSPCPRTVAYVGKMQNAGLPTDLQFDCFTGAAGEGFASEYVAFLKIFRDLPNIDKILMAPDTVPVPNEPGVLYAIAGALASRMNDMNAANAFRYLKKLPAEIGVACVKDTLVKNDKIVHTRAYIEWASDNGNLLLN